MTNVHFLYLLVSLGLAFVLSPPVINLSKRLGLVDRPKSAPHKQHKRTVALAGGPVIVLVFALSTRMFSGLWEEPITDIFPALLVILVFGLVDDYLGLSASFKLLGQLIAVSVVVSAGIQVRLFPQEWLNLSLTALWIVGITNAFNFLDGGDGLALGIAITTNGFLFGASAIGGQVDLATNSVVFLGALLGFYFYNARPARAFLGDSGAQSIGFLLSVFALYYIPSGYSPLSSWFVPILLFAIPIFDVCLVVISRFRRRTPIHRGQLDHTYHRLRILSESDLQVQIGMFLAAGFVDSLALASLEFPPLVGNIIFFVLTGIGAGTMIFLERVYTTSLAVRSN